MMVITSKMYLQAIHEATKAIALNELSDMDNIHSRMQERVLKDLEDWEPDDCMVDGYDHSAFSPYKHLVPSIDEITKDKLIQCEECIHVFPKNMVAYQKTDNAYICKECSDTKSSVSKVEEKEGVNEHANQ